MRSFQTSLRTGLHVRILLGACALAAACGKNSDTHFDRGNAYFDKQQFAEAIIEYRTALQDDPNRGDIRVKLSQAWLNDGNGDEAVTEAVRAADLLPADAAAQLTAGR